jgi:hypothetical protein
LIALDTNSLIRAFGDLREPQAIRIRELLATAIVRLPPVVVAEMLSHPMLPEDVRDEVLTMPTLKVRDGYWMRAGLLRADLRRHGFKAQLADCLVAQSCIDHDIPLITYDRDFRHFVRAGLQLA